MEVTVTDLYVQQFSIKINKIAKSGFENYWNTHFCFDISMR